MVFTHGIPPDFYDGVHLFIYTAMICYRVSPEFIGSVTQLRSDCIHCQESTGTGSAVLKVVPVTGAVAFELSPWIN